MKVKSEGIPKVCLVVKRYTKDNLRSTYVLSPVPTSVRLYRQLAVEIIP